MRAGHRIITLVILSLTIIAGIGTPSFAAAPTVSITSPVGLTSNPTPTLTYTVSDGIVVVKLDGTPVTKASGDRLDAGEGMHTIRVEATNAAGETGFDEKSFTVDTIAPAAAVYKKIAAGTFHTLALGIDGSLWAWGLNNLGKLGDGTTINRSTPVSVATGTVWKDVTAGANHSLAIKADGTLWAWGQNPSGQLGDGTITNRTSPKKIGTDNTWVAVEAGSSHSIALKSDGTLWAWGDNAYGQLGNGTNDDSNQPVKVINPDSSTTWIDVSTSESFNVALRSDGTLWAWGINTFGQLGDPSLSNHNAPFQIGSGTNWASAAAGANHVVAIDKDGHAWAWGYNGSGRLGNNSTTNSSQPVRVGDTVSKEYIWSKVSCGGNHTLALRQDGTLWAWGYNFHGELGDGTTAQRLLPTQIGTGNTWAGVFGGTYYSVALRADGTMWVWGYDTYGAVGRTTPAQVGVERSWTSAAGGIYHSAALRNDGTLWAWGDNFYGQVGNGTVNQQASPFKIVTGPTATGSNWAKVVAGNNHTAALKSDGTLWTWGQNTSGQLGDDGATKQRTKPARVGQNITWIDVAAGANHTAAIRSDGTLWAWGLNSSGQLGNGTTTNRTTPFQITTGTAADNDWVQVAAGDSHTIALKSNGTLWAWGANGAGQLGNGTTTGSLTPIQVGTAENWKFAAAGNSYTMAIKTDGTLWGWGANTVGQLGNGTTKNKTSPLQTGSDTRWQKIELGAQQSIGLMTDGSLWAWGGNSYGEVGNGSETGLTSPQHIRPDLTWANIGAGNLHSLAVAADGTLWTWGYNGFGQLGDGTVAQKLAPVEAERTAVNVISINNGAAYTNNRTVSLTLAAMDANGIVEMMFTNDTSTNTWSAPETYATTKSWALSYGDGPKSVWAKFKDAAGNWSEAYRADITLDTSIPTVQIMSPVEGIINDRTPRLLYTVGEGVVDVRITLDPMLGQLPRVSGDTLGPLADGTYYLTVRVYDGAGNVGEASRCFTVDTTPPYKLLDSGGSKIATGPYWTLAIGADGNLWAWGGNYYGQLGDGTKIGKTAPVRINSSVPWLAIDAGIDHSVGIKNDGTLWAWGGNYYGQLGDGTTEDRAVPVRIGNDTWRAVAAALYSTAAIKTDGTLWVWGYTGDMTRVPVQVGSGSSWSAVALVGEEIFAFRNDGTLWSGSYSSQMNDLMPPFTDIAVADDYVGQAAVAIGPDGSLWEQGFNYWFFLRGRYWLSPDSSNVVFNTNWAAVSAGTFHTLTLKSDGTLWAWGDNDFGQLGDKTSTWRYDPVQIGAETTWVAIKAGGGHSIAMRADGSIWAWGANNSGQLGIAGGQRKEPTLVATLPKAAVSVVPINNGAVLTKSATVTLDLTALDATGVSSMQLSNNGVNWTDPEPYAASKVWTLAPGIGERHVYVRYSDVLGNWSESYTGTVQSDPRPTVTITSPAQGSVTKANPILNFEASGAPASVFLNGQPISAQTDTALNTPGDGLYTLRVEVANEYGTVSDEVTFVVDSTPPIVTISSPLAGAINSKTPQLTYSVIDGTATVTTVKVDGGGAQSIPSGSSLDLTNGAHTVLVTATDAAGNVGSAQVKVKVDTAPPTVAIFSPVAGVINSSSVPLNYAVSDGSVTVSVDGGAMYIASGSTINGFSNGSHTITVSSKDAAGNTGSASVTFMVVDTSTDIHDETNIYCKGTGTYVVGASSFTSGIYVPTSGNAVHIAAPADLSTITGQKTIVKGAMDTTVPVNSVMVVVTSGTATAGYPAQVNGHYFAAKVPVTTDTTRITAIATDQTGGKHQTNVNISVTAQASPVGLLANPSVGIPVQKGSNPASLDVSLTASTALSGLVANYAWDFDGSGTDDVTCYSHSDIKATYRQTGLYLTKVSVKELEGQVFTDTEIVNVVDPAEMDGVFKSIWNGMKAKLGSQDIEGALGYFRSQSQDKYREIFTALNAVLPQMVQEMQDIEVVSVTDNTVMYRIRKNEMYGGQTVTMSYYIYFTSDGNGLWGIEKF